MLAMKSFSLSLIKGPKIQGNGAGLGGSKRHKTGSFGLASLLFKGREEKSSSGGAIRELKKERRKGGVFQVVQKGKKFANLVYKSTV